MSTKLKAGTATSGAVIDADTAGTLEIQTGSTPTTAITIDASQNVGVGTASPTAKAQIGDGTVVATNRLVFGKAQASSETNLPAIGQQSASGAGNDLALAGTSTSAVIRFYTGASTNSGEIGTGSNAERMRIDSSGNLLVGVTTTIGNHKVRILQAGATPCLALQVTGSDFQNMVTFYNSSGTAKGSISSPGSTSVAYNTTSDYRLKENVAPITGALELVQKLKPVTYTWKGSEATDNGFIAHELQEFLPNAVAGEKDAVEEDGSIKPQGVDYSKIVATLTAAIQEQQAMIEELKTKVAALEAK